MNKNAAIELLKDAHTAWEKKNPVDENRASKKWAVGKAPEIKKLNEAQVDVSKLKKRLKEAEKKRDAARLALADKCLGRDSDACSSDYSNERAIARDLKKFMIDNGYHKKQDGMLKDFRDVRRVINASSRKEHRIDACRQAVALFPELKKSNIYTFLDVLREEVND